MAETYDGMMVPRGPARVIMTRRKHLLVALILLVFFGSSVYASLMFNFGFEHADMLLDPLVSVLVYLWCRYDAAEHGRKIGLGLSFTILLFVMLGFAVYLYGGRRYPTGKAVSVMFFWTLIFAGFSFAGYYSFSWLLDQLYY